MTCFPGQARSHRVKTLSLALVVAAALGAQAASVVQAEATSHTRAW